mgnify:CR=1 FL=1
MQLDEFISKSLKSIIKGTKEAQSFAKENGAIINPYVGKWDYDKINKAKQVLNLSDDEFKGICLAVEEMKNKETGGEAGINVYSLKLGGKASDKETNESISRIKFSLTAMLPNESSE